MIKYHLFFILLFITAIVKSQPGCTSYLEGQTIVTDVKIDVSRAEASEAQRGEGINRSIDGDQSTVYHSRKTRTNFPVTLTYYFEDTEQIDYFVYYPHSNESNGNFKEVEVWVSTDNHPEFVKAGEYNFNGSAAPSKINFSGGLKLPKAVRFVIKSGMGGSNGSYVNCAEMAFFLKVPQPAVPSVFTDETCSELNLGINQKMIDDIDNKFFRCLALSLLNNNYDREFRIQDYKPYPPPEIKAVQNKTLPYSLLDNATGICVKEGEEIIVFVGKTGGESISLRLVESGKIILDWWDMKATTYMLNEGANRIIADQTGLLYVMYHTDNPNAKPVKIHIATGTVNGYYDIAKHTPEDWESLLNRAQDEQFDILGKYAHISFTADSLRSNCFDVNRLIQVYDSIVWLQQKFIGLEKYNRANINRMFFHVDYNILSYVWGHATAYRTAYSFQAMRVLLHVEKLRSTSIWGVAHEVGHINQTRPGFLWGGMSEVSNNLYALYVQHAFGNRSRLANEKADDYNNCYEKGFTEILEKQALHSTHKDVFCKLIPFWQLELYYSQVKGYTDFYADVHEQIRLRPDPATDSEAILAFVKICCDVAEEDLTDFFKAWGLLKEADFNGNYQGYGSGSLSLEITSDQVNEVVHYASKYPKPAMNLQYIHEENTDIFYKDVKLSKGTIEVKDDSDSAIPAIEINENLAKVDLLLSDICSDISYTKLEFDDNYPIGVRANGLYVSDEYIFFQNNGKILRYTRDGKKVQMIGSMGQGPGKYTIGSSFVIDEANKKMYIYDNFTSSILIYDYDKNIFLNSFNLQNPEGFFLAANDGILLRSGVLRRRYNPQYFSWELLDSEGKTVYKKENSNFTKPNPNHRWKALIATSSHFWKTANHSFCSIFEQGSDTIFSISNEFKTTPRFFINSSIRIDGENATEFYAETSNYLFWRLEDYLQKKYFYGFYDKTSNESYIYSQRDYGDTLDAEKTKRMGVRNDIDGGLPVRIPYAPRSSSHWNFFVQPLHLIEYINSPEFRNATVKDSKKKEALERFVKTLDEDDNPVLVTVTLK